MKQVLIVCFNDLKTDARVTRQINFLKDNYKLTVACYDAYLDPKYEVFVMKKTKLTLPRKAVSSVFLLLGLNRIAYSLLFDYKRYVNDLKKLKFDLIVANDVETLPFAFQIADKTTKVFLDAHEYAPRQFEDRLYWRIFFQRFITDLCKKYIPMVHGMSTINNGLAKAYEKEMGIKPLIITNATDFVDQQPLPLSAYPIKLVHHGIFTISRQPHLMVDLMKLLDDRFTLDLIYLLPASASKKTKAYFESFKAAALATGKIKILPPLKSSDIVPFIHQRYDLGIILVPPVNFNYQNGLPNKLFDCIQARMGMAVGPLHEIAEVTQTHKIGVVSKEFTAESMAEALMPITVDDVNTFKKNSNAAAMKMNAGFNKITFLKALEQIV